MSSSGMEMVAHPNGGSLTTQSRGLERALGGAAEAAAVESIRAHFVMAKEFIRDWMDIRSKVLAECKRPGFARAARYDLRSFNRGEGFSVRYTDAVARIMGNVIQRAPVRYQDDEVVVYEQQVIDLESNFLTSQDVTIRKVVERQAKSREALEKEGREVVDEGRRNKAGGMVFLCRATEDEMRTRINSELARARRNCTIRAIPPDILEESLEQVAETRRLGEKALDPAAERKKIADAFDELGVLPSELTEYLGHSLDQTSPVELRQLRELYNGIREGELRWHEVLEQKRTQREDARSEREELQRSAEEKADKAKAARERADAVKRGEPPPPATTSPTAMTPDPKAQPQVNRDQSLPGYKFSDFLKAVQRGASEHGVSTLDDIRKDLVEVFGKEHSDPKKISDRDRLLYVHGWLEQEPDAKAELHQRRIELGAVDLEA